MTALHQLPVHEAVEQIYQKQLKPSALMQAYAEQISAHEAKIGAFIELDIEGALARARALDDAAPEGLLFGIGFGVKDIIDTADLPTGYGSPIYKGYQPRADAACVLQLKNQGAILVGKTVTTEFAVFHPGKTVNPHNHAHTPGGSSSGSAAAVAANFVPLALGTQTAASIFRPASFCGVVGYKPSYGLISRVGAKTLAESFDTLGPMGRCVADVALMAAAAAKRHDLVIHKDTARQNNKPRVGVFRSPYWGEAEPAMQEAVLDMAARLARQSVSVTEIDSAPFEGLADAQNDFMLWQAAIALAHEYQHHRDQCSPKLIEVLELGQAMPWSKVEAAMDRMAAARQAIEAVFQDVDLLITPAAPGEAPEGLAATGNPIFGRSWIALGTPGLTLPTGTGPKGLPLGVLAVGAPGQDRAFLQAAHALEGLVRQ